MADKIQEPETLTMNTKLLDRDPDQTVEESEQILPIFEKLSNRVTNLRKEQIELCNEFKSITADSFHGSEVFDALQSLGEEHETLKKKYQEECQMLKNRCQLECSERRRLYNQVIELKGNIRVFCRCRPMNHDEISKGSSLVVDFDSAQENELKMIGPDSSRKHFKFDHIFRPEDNQEVVFAQTSPLVVSVLDGFNVCIFAYGQTGTGKTFTMEGTAENWGVNYRTLNELFKVSNERSDIMKYQLFVSMLEVYNEKIKDLLVEDTDHPTKKLEIKQSAEGTQEVPGLSQVRVHKTDEVWELLKSGSRVRSVGSTNANELSSRSHCLLRVTVLGENLVNGQRTRSHLWLVDLAGSERVGKTEVEGERLKESQFINKSLSALGDVISALASKNAHIPYRNSKLTHILQRSLGGDCKTLMFVQISPSSADLGETICSLNFASRVRGVEHGPARKQTDVNELFKYKQLADKAKHDEKETKKLQDSLQSVQVRLIAREHVCKTLQEKVRDLENQLAEERKTRQKQENRALAVASSHSLLSSMKHSLSTISEKRPPSKMRLPLRRISSFMPSPATTQIPRPFTASRFSNEDIENRSRPASNFKPLSRALQGSFTSQIKPKRRASIATFHSEPSSSSSTMTTPITRSSAAPRMRSDRVVGRRQSFVWRTQQSPLCPSSAFRSMTVEATPVAAPRSSRFMGSPHSHIVGSWKPKHPTVVALQQKQLVWSPLKYRGTKGVRKPFV
ncbi:putative minus-end-directed kinesin ATPase [Helianthus annuus]|uniref:Kinesin-like protein n=1 Tax=Helianthus annuus TaxID=4232 RepID=A0A251S7K8_HELAN|nr:kinesin-like protein KIN-14S [Helianthus annuus]KAF5803224.1 putative minus-end-directed kinesin ATPase [Helianthus annuus]KAJ0567819.1 putative minus-end-directed kinesin ATPase [Helianthus annuus]KAJ0574271.1 putative minus-end-directed kinesin ATPase [Helianthus annuus]KAJ0738606.1 putative minus-end-directed kinesin ATPase [Helianthus annuus]KAJ0741486.1 putative minus-end-directed kinesin ATPase [Helianthus annuus]